MENEKTIEEIFKDIKDSDRLQYLKDKLGQAKKDKNGEIQVYPSPKFSKYLELKAKYNDLSSNLNAVKSNVENGDVNAMTELNFSGSSQIKKIENAMKQWTALGYKNEVEKIIEQSEK